MANPLSRLATWIVAAFAAMAGAITVLRPARRAGLR
jgi:hypothetical protein